jgi:hypothetical protein
LVLKFIEKGCNLEVIDEEKENTPLFWAIEINNKYLIMEILKRDCLILHRNNTKLTAAGYALNNNLDEFWITQFTGAGCYHYIDDFDLVKFPDIVLSSSESEIVVGESVILSADQIAEEQVWFASDATQIIGTGLSIEVSPIVSSTYYLRSLQCKMYAWDTVYVKVRQPLPPPFEPLKLFISNTISKENFLINYTGDERPLLNMALFNSVGQLVHVQEITESAAIPTSGYAPGIYYCRIFKGSEFVLTEKIVVMK